MMYLLIAACPISTLTVNGKRSTEAALKTFIEPEEVVLGQKFISRAGLIEKKARIGYIIPFEKSLNNLLSMPEVWSHVLNGHCSVDDFMRDICDGNSLKKTLFFK